MLISVELACVRNPALPFHSAPCSPCTLAVKRLIRALVYTFSIVAVLLWLARSESVVVRLQLGQFDQLDPLDPDAAFTRPDRAPAAAKPGQRIGPARASSAGDLRAHRSDRSRVEFGRERQLPGS